MDRVALIRAEAERLADVLSRTDADARVPTCPDWDAADLLWHVVEVHSFWAAVLAGDPGTAAEVEAIQVGSPPRPATTAEMLALRAAATEALLAQLAALDDDVPRWSWADDHTVGFTRRMQTYEATMHRVDAELAAGVPVGPIAPDVAAGAVGHAIDHMWGWQPGWAAYESLAVVQFAATDTGESWLVEVGHWTGTGPESGKEFDEPIARRASSGEPRALASATAEQLALWAWNRGGTAEITGEPDSLAALGALIAHGMP